MKSLLFLVLIYIPAFSLANLKCIQVLAPKNIAEQLLLTGERVDQWDVEGEPLSMQQFREISRQLKKEKLIWPSLEEFAELQIETWKPTDKIRNFLSYTFAIYVKVAENQFVKIHMPIVSFKDTRSGGFSWHIHIRQYLQENFVEREQFTFIEKGAVIIEKRGNKFLVQDNNAYPHIETTEGRKVFGVKDARVVIVKKN